MMLDNTMEFRRVNMSSSGGNDIVQYYSYLGYAGEGDIIDMGAKSDYNRITARQNVNVKINDHAQRTVRFLRKPYLPPFTELWIRLGLFI